MHMCVCVFIDVHVPVEKSIAPAPSGERVTGMREARCGSQSRSEGLTHKTLSLILRVYRPLPEQSK